MSLLPENSEGYIRILVFLQTFERARNLKFEQLDFDNKYSCFLIFAYDIKKPNNEPIVYSSINRALKALKISYSSLLDHINNYYIYKPSNFILSFEPVSIKNFNKYTLKLIGDNQIRKHITVFNLENEEIIEFKSGREMANYFKIDGKVARNAIAKGEFLDYILIVKDISYRKAVYVYDSNTLKLIVKLESLTAALKFAKVNFYTMKDLINSGKTFEEKIYSYKDKL
jgi:hypothetical protein